MFASSSRPSLLPAGKRIARFAGSTLTEVLVALLIMSIGIVSLTTLFPLSILRSIKASQLTKGTDLRFNAEALLALYPKMISDPDVNTATATNYPDFYVIDPLGWNIVNNTPTPALAATFGNDQGAAYPSNFVAGINTGGVTRWNFRRTTLAAADYLVTLPDTWVPQADGVFVAGTLVKRIAAATGPTQVEVTGLNGFALTAGISSRVVLFGADGISSQVRTLTDVQQPVSGTYRLFWTEDIANVNTLDPGEDINGNGVIDDYGLSPAFIPAAVRIDSQERRYTWMLTCRKTTSALAADVDVTIFFGRSIENPTDDEALYPAKVTSGQKLITVDYSSAPSAPLAKKGGFVFDANNARWYRITSVNDNKSGSMDVGIEIPAFAGSPAAGGRVMFPKGVVDVYPLPTKIVVAQ
jgi:hypothetical protein